MIYIVSRVANGVATLCFTFAIFSSRSDHPAPWWLSAVGLITVFTLALIVDYWERRSA